MPSGRVIKQYQGPESSGAWSQGAKGTARSLKDAWRQHDEEQRDRRDQEQQAKVGRKRGAPSPSEPPPDTNSAALAAGATLLKREARDAQDWPPQSHASRRASGVSDEAELRCAKCQSTDTRRWGWGGEMLCEACYLVPSTPRAPLAQQWRVSDRVHARHGRRLKVCLARPPTALEVHSLAQGCPLGAERTALAAWVPPSVLHCGCRCGALVPAQGR